MTMTQQPDPRIEQEIPIVRRCAHAKTALDEYEIKHDKGVDTETIVSDLLADLMHFCDDAKTFDWQKVLDRASLHYNAEREVERDDERE